MRARRLHLMPAIYVVHRKPRILSYLKYTAVIILVGAFLFASTAALPSLPADSFAIVAGRLTTVASENANSTYDNFFSILITTAAIGAGCAVALAAGGCDTWSRNRYSKGNLRAKTGFYTAPFSR